VPLAGGRPATIVARGAEPAFSPDGTEVAFVRFTRRKPPPGWRFPVYGGDLFVAAADGSSIRRLTHSPARREEAPSWDPSGARLAYTQYPAKLHMKALLGDGSSVMEINADGTCRHRILFTYGLSYRAAAWQPGPGRGAGRIEC
jgi:Tol biopolymer transport system component